MVVVVVFALVLVAGVVAAAAAASAVVVIYASDYDHSKGRCDRMGPAGQAATFALQRRRPHRQQQRCQHARPPLRKQTWADEESRPSEDCKVASGAFRILRIITRRGGRVGTRKQGARACRGSNIHCLTSLAATLPKTRPSSNLWDVDRRERAIEADKERKTLPAKEGALASRARTGQRFIELIGWLKM